MARVWLDELPYPKGQAPWTWRLPGTRLAGPDDWAACDAAYPGQMALRDRLIADEGDAVIAQMDRAAEPVHELLSFGLQTALRLPGFGSGKGCIRRPDGKLASIDETRPLETLGRVFQQDLCILQPSAGEEHVLTAAVLCFPAHWTLDEKIGKPLLRIHKPVEAYGPDTARRVQRLFDGLQVGRPIWRANAHPADDDELFTPVREGVVRAPVSTPSFVRSEHQVLFRLPRTRAVVFSIKTMLVPVARLSEADRALVPGLQGGSAG